MKKKRYQFISKDGKVRGLITARDEQEVAKFAGRRIEELIIEEEIWVLEGLQSRVKGGRYGG